MKKAARLFLCGISITLFINCKSTPDIKNADYAKNLHNKILTIDTHCDTPLNMIKPDWDISKHHTPTIKDDSKIDLPRMKQGGLDALFFAAFVGQRDRDPEQYEIAENKADNLINAIHKMCQQNNDIIRMATSPDEIYKNNEQGYLSALIGIENGFAIAKNIKNIKKFYDKDVRYITLSHSKNNDICDSSTDGNGPEHNGLSEFGKQVVHEMNNLGMIIDVSHISDKAFYDVLSTSKAPVIASHSCVRSLCDHPRNMTDDMIRALAKNNGVLQMCILDIYLKTPDITAQGDSALKKLDEKFGPFDKLQDAQKQQYELEKQEIMNKYPSPRASVKDIVDHIDHVVKLVGIDYVGIGTDFDGGGGVDGCNDVSELPNITIELVKRGYSDKDIEKIWGKNFIRVFNQVIKQKQTN